MNPYESPKANDSPAVARVPHGRWAGATLIASQIALLLVCPGSFFGPAAWLTDYHGARGMGWYSLGLLAMLVLPLLAFAAASASLLIEHSFAFRGLLIVSAAFQLLYVFVVAGMV